MSAATLLQTSLSDLKLVRRGKVRDVYAVDDESLLIVATDRISAFDCILPTPIQRKGEVLTALSEFWFEKLGHVVANHLITAKIEEMPTVVQQHAETLSGRTSIARPESVSACCCTT